MRSRFVLTIVTLALSACALPEYVVKKTYSLPDFTSSPAAWRELELPMRDGVRLHTSILMPEGVEKAPVVLIRNPYHYVDRALEVQCRVYARYGIGCVVQDVRGRLQSEGEWEPLIHEADDGHDTLTWLAAQPWAESIALWGVSYLAATALSASDDLPPKVKTLVLTVFGVSLRSAAYERGLFHHELLTAWAAYMPSRGLAEKPMDTYRAALRHRPHLEADEKALGHHLDFYRSWLTSVGPDDGEWAKPRTREFEALPPKLKVPILYIEGFDDPFLPSALDTWERLGDRPESTLAILPMNHTGMQSGDVTVDVDTLGAYTYSLMVPWMLHHLKGAPLPFETGVVKSWPRGGSGPVVRRDWPGETVERRLALDATVAAEAPCVQRQLVEQAPKEGTLAYRYDPKRPWRSEGGARGLAYLIVNGERTGPTRQTWTCRDDVLRFTTTALDADTRLLGRMRLELSVRSSAKDTAFVAKLVDIDEGGRAVHVTDGAATLHWPLAETRAPEPYTPGATRRLELDFFPTEWVLKKGHRLGLWVSSSNYPFFSLHLNTEKPWYEADVFYLADQEVLLGGENPSALVLRVDGITRSP